MRNNFFSVGKLKLAIFFCSIVISGNCSITQSQQRALQNFGETAVSMANVSSNELISMRNSTIQMNLTRIRLENSSKAKEEASAKDAPEYKDLDGVFDIKVISIRLKAIAAIRSYAKLLLALASDASQKELDRATQNFLFAVENLSSDHRKIDEKKLNSIGEAIRLFGGIFTEYKKKDSIKDIILDSKEQIETLCDLLAKDFDPKGGRLATAYILTGEELQLSADEKLDPNEGKSEKVKIKALSAFHLAEKNIQKKETILPEIAKSILSLKQANTELFESFRSEVYNAKDIVKFANTVKAVQDYRAILK
ncbi:MAG: hypothetical protein KBF99_20360 [Leptospiraceae bacterium]|jgi:hypothetical protein|nr:hypothetical protein [Leptospiraceae bacterium]